MHHAKLIRGSLRRIEEIVQMEEKVRAHGLPGDAYNFRQLKAMGFSDARLATLIGESEAEVNAKRTDLNVHPIYKTH